MFFVGNNEAADFNNIQAAINESSHGDIIVLQRGIYTGKGKPYGYSVRGDDIAEE